MKKIFFLLIFIPLLVKPQIYVSGGMGINYFAPASLRDYLTMNFPSSNSPASFSATIVFFGEAGMPVSDKIDVAIEYGYQIYSYNAPSLGGGVYDFSMGIHRITALGYYVIKGNGYRFQFGLGGGLRIASVDEEIYTKINYSTAGAGLVLKANGMTAIDGNLFVNLGLESGYDLTGEPSSNGSYIANPVLKKNLSLNAFYIGLKLGVTYFF